MKENRNKLVVDILSELIHLYQKDMSIEQILESIKKTEVEPSKSLPADEFVNSIELPESNDKDIKMEAQKKIRQETFGNYYRGSCHYMKYILPGETDNISIRLYYQFDDRPEYEAKFVIKDHRTKNYVVLDTQVAINIIASTPNIQQHRVITFPDGKKYIKTCVEGYDQNSELTEDRTISIVSSKNTSTRPSRIKIKNLKKEGKFNEKVTELY
jgi:hypothetical protein